MGLIKLYQKFISPMLGNNCRFYPSCSQYAYLCFANMPWYKAFWFSARRILRCSPLTEGGFDCPPGVEVDEDVRHE